MGGGAFLLPPKVGGVLWRRETFCSSAQSCVAVLTLVPVSAAGLEIDFADITELRWDQLHC